MLAQGRRPWRRVGSDLFEDLRLASVEVLVADEALVLQVGEIGEALLDTGTAARSCGRGGRRAGLRERARGAGRTGCGRRAGSLRITAALRCLRIAAALRRLRIAALLRIAT